MKKLVKLFAFFALMPMLMLTSCSDDSDDPQPEAQNRFDDLKTYMIDNNMDLPNVLDGWIVNATTVYETNTDNDDANDFYIIDIRNESDYTDGHIDGAVNTTLPNVLNAAADAGGQPIVVACYTGQNAGHAVVALRLSGYTDAKVLMWGMSGWNSETAASWVNNTGSFAVGDNNWMAAPGEIAANDPMNAPELMYVTDDMAEVLAERVQALLDGGFKGVNSTDVVANPDGYFINNYWSTTDVEHYGNIKGAHRIQPLTLKDGEYAYLDGSAKVVTYCWTGQTSSMITAYLTVLGYDAYSLKFGANGMIYSELESHKYTEPSGDNNYPLTSGAK